MLGVLAVHAHGRKKEAKRQESRPDFPMMEKDPGMVVGSSKSRIRERVDPKVKRIRAWRVKQPSPKVKLLG